MKINKDVAQSVIRNLNVTLENIVMLREANAELRKLLSVKETEMIINNGCSCEVKIKHLESELALSTEKVKELEEKLVYSHVVEEAYFFDNQALEQRLAQSEAMIKQTKKFIEDHGNIDISWFPLEDDIETYLTGGK